MQGQGGFGQGRQGVPGVFKAKYHAYSPAYWNSENRDKLEKGDKIVLPASALETLSRMHVRFPIMFEIAHDSEILPKKSHCSVLEFTAAEGSVYLPLWMIDNLGLDATGDSIVELTTVSLDKGTFVQFQAHETKFAMLANPRVVLEKALRNYSCLTVGDTIQIEFNKYVYKLDVTEVKPSVIRGTAPPAIDIIETDINVDFKEPRDYKEWEKKQQAKKARKFDHVKGVYVSNDGNDNSNKNNNNNNNSGNNNNNNNNYNSSEYDSKRDESKGNDGLFDDNDDGFVIQDWQTQKAKAKQGYFDQLKMSGSQGQKVKDKKSKNKSKQPSQSSQSQLQAQAQAQMPTNKVRGAPLGVKSANSPMMSSQTTGAGGSGSNGKKTKTSKTEEIIGNMRYIYEVDEMGNRNLIRRLPMRKLPMGGTGYSLK